MTDRAHMTAALSLARRHLGETWPNPSVGCVIVRDGTVVGRGVTAVGGRPHAEVAALAMAGEAARGATAYVTLEPCAHHGHTGPCADALIAAGIARAVVALRDPYPAVNGRGLARLRAAGTEVEEGLLAAEAAELNAGFLTRVTAGRPLVTLKLATTLDGRIATAKGESQWITGPAARHAAQVLRGTHDAVMAGIGTILADDPGLTCRLPGFRTRPVTRVVLDSHGRLPPGAQLVRDALVAPTIQVHAAPIAAPIAASSLPGVTRLRVAAGPDGRIDLHAALRALAAVGLTRILAEGGAGVAAALFAAGAVDRIAWFHAPSVMGDDGLPATRAFGVAALADLPRYERIAVTPLGADVLTEFRRSG
jgi:diaminohydroxyphosphoribosylaminopyrimidine deaminase/5-amino-6-(5-phosphoribosylamino)uracil reductase